MKKSSASTPTENGLVESFNRQLRIRIYSGFILVVVGSCGSTSERAESRRSQAGGRRQEEVEVEVIPTIAIIINFELQCYKNLDKLRHSRFDNLILSADQRKESKDRKREELSDEMRQKLAIRETLKVRQTLKVRKRWKN